MSITTPVRSTYADMHSKIGKLRHPSADRTGRPTMRVLDRLVEILEAFEAVEIPAPKMSTTDSAVSLTWGIRLGVNLRQNGTEVWWVTPGHLIASSETYPAKVRVRKVVAHVRLTGLAQ